MITLEQAKKLQVGTIVHHTINKNADGTPQRWKVTGKVKIWKKSPEKISIPIKFGLYGYAYITENDLELVSIPD